MHSLRIPAAHFVPIVPSQLELDAFGKLDLRISGKIVEPRFARGFLRQIPAHFVKLGFMLDPGAERVVLPGAAHFEILEPGQELRGFVRSLGRTLGDLIPKPFEERPLEAKHVCVPIDRTQPVIVRKTRLEALAVPPRKALLNDIGEHVLRSGRCKQLYDAYHQARETGFAPASSLASRRGCAFSALPKPATLARSTCGCSARGTTSRGGSGSRWPKGRWPVSSLAWTIGKASWTGSGKRDRTASSSSKQS